MGSRYFHSTLQYQFYNNHGDRKISILNSWSSINSQESSPHQTYLLGFTEKKKKCKNSICHFNCQIQNTVVTMAVELCC